MDVAEVQRQVNVLRERQAQQDIAIAVMDTKLDKLKESVDSLNSSAGRLTWTVILAVLAAVLKLVLG